MTDTSLPALRGLPAVRPSSLPQGRDAASDKREFRYATALKLMVVAAFLPEDLSLFAGDFRIPVVRIMIMVLAVVATFRSAQHGPDPVRVPSDIFALLAGIWMIVSGVVIDGADVGLKTGGALALEFTGSYYVFRRLLGPPDSTVQIASFACKVVVVVCGLAILDPLSGRVLTHETAAALTGYAKTYAIGTDSYSRNGLVRAMGPLEHSILFGTVCAWFATIALFCFRFSRLGIGIPLVALIGILCSQSKGPLLAYGIGLAMIAYFFATPGFTARWRVLGAAVLALVLVIFVFSNSPVATLLQFGGLDPEAGWYRQAIWSTAGPAVLQSPIFGIGVLDDWNWQQSDVLVGPTVDALWLRAAMTFGIPGSLLVFLTMVGAFWLGPVQSSRNLTEAEKRLAVALGIATSISVFLGFTVHFWGTCWIILGIFAGMRASLAASARTDNRIGEPEPLAPHVGADPIYPRRRLLVAAPRK